jgi:hypothetical protein
MPMSRDFIENEKKTRPQECKAVVNISNCNNKTNSLWSFTCIYNLDLDLPEGKSEHICVSAFEVVCHARLFAR